MVIQPGQVVAGLEALLRVPAPPGDLDEGSQGDLPWKVAVVERHLAGALMRRTSSQWLPGWPATRTSRNTRPNLTESSKYLRERLNFPWYHGSPLGVPVNRVLRKRSRRGDAVNVGVIGLRHGTLRQLA